MPDSEHKTEYHPSKIHIIFKNPAGKQRIQRRMRCLFRSVLRLVLRLLGGGLPLPAPPLPEKAARHGANRRQKQQPHPAVGQGHGQTLQCAHKPPPARSKGRAHAACKTGSRLLHIGELVHLLEGEMDSGVVHQGVILPQGAGEPLDLQLRVEMADSMVIMSSIFSAWASRFCSRSSLVL